MSSVNIGFIEAGHLYGCPAVIVEIDADSPPVSFSDIAALAQRDKHHVHMVINDAGERGSAAAHEAGLLSRSLREAGVDSQSIQVRPGVWLPDSSIVHACTLTLIEDDVISFKHAHIDPHVASISVHCWPSSAILAALERICEAPRGRFLILTDEDFGTAKVWMRSRPGWRLHARKDYNQIEADEFNEMIAYG